MQESAEHGMSVDFVEGFQYDNGYCSPYLVTHPASLEAILDAVGASERPVSVDALAEALHVSAATIRRDIALLERQGAVARSWGRVSRPGSFSERTVGERAAQSPAEKRRIAEAAARLVGDGALIGLTGGTTTLALARSISGLRSLTVVTTSLSVGMHLATRPNVRLFLSGGETRMTSFELSGPLADDTLAGFNLDMAFLGVDGIDARGGCTAWDPAEARTNAILMRQAARTVVVADASKLGRVSFARICPAADVDTFITDTGADSAAVAELTELGVVVECV